MVPQAIMRDKMKGQYFSFDAIIATVIMVVAITSLVTYWLGAQAVVESRFTPLYSDALRIAESLLSPGAPANWDSSPDFSGVRQIGIANGFGDELNASMVKALFNKIGLVSSDTPNYLEAGRVMRAPAKYYILIQTTEGKSLSSCDGFVECQIGQYPPANATEVVVAHRGAVLEGHPVHIRVFLWRQ